MTSPQIIIIRHQKGRIIKGCLTSSKRLAGVVVSEPVRPHVEVGVIQLVALTRQLVLGVVVVVAHHGQDEQVWEGFVQESCEVARDFLDLRRVYQISERLVVNMRWVVPKQRIESTSSASI